MSASGRRFLERRVESTNALALAALEAGRARHLDRFVAREQTAGRGQRGRRWSSPDAGGLYLSLVWVPPEAESARPEPTAMTMAAGLAALDTVRALGLERAALKWPNDLVVPAEGGADATARGSAREPAKLAGVLIETRSDRAGLVVGIGLNVGQREFEPELVRERAVTSLALEGVPLALGEREAALDRAEEALVRALERRLGQAGADPTVLAADFLAATGLAGLEVDVELPRETRVGRLVSLDGRGGLHLEREGRLERLELAHVSGVRPRPAPPSAP